MIDTTQITSPDNESNPLPGDPCHTLNAHQHVPLLIGTLSAAGGRNRNLGQENEIDMLVVQADEVFRRNGFSNYETGKIAQTITSHDAKEADNLIALKWSASSTTDQIVRQGDYAGALRGTNNGYDAISSPQHGVRRLTPIECERLQGFSDNYTLFGKNGKTMSDTARYQKVGNAVCRKVGRWIGRRIVQVHQGEQP